MLYVQVQAEHLRKLLELAHNQKQRLGVLQVRALCTACSLHRLQASPL